MLLFFLQSTVRDLFSFDTESELKEMVVEETPEEKVAEKKNTKSQNAFEQVRGVTPAQGGWVVSQNL